MSFSRQTCVMVVAALAVGTGCGGDHSDGDPGELAGAGATPAAARQSKTSAAVTDYPLKGVVKKVEKESR